MAGEQLLSTIDAYLPLERARFVKGSLKFAEEAHRGQRRMSGEPFIEHPIATASLLADLKMDATTIAAALLHDVVEDCGIRARHTNQRIRLRRVASGGRRDQAQRDRQNLRHRVTGAGRSPRSQHAEDARGDGRGHPRRNDQAGRQAPQHADVVSPPAGESRNA